MDFSRLPFLYCLLAVTIPAYFLFRSRPWRNLVLLGASLVFYAWGEPKYVLIMLLAVAVAFCGGLLMDRFRTQGRDRAEKLTFLVTTSLLLLNLIVFKYLGFFRDNLVRLPFLDLPPVSLTLPIGISFYTFQILSYVIDLHRKEIAVQRNPFYLALYLSFFPQLIAGPIVRYQTIEAEIVGRQETWDDIIAGARRFILGLAKKVILANGVARAAEIIYAGDPAIFGSAAYWLAALAYTFQLYFDFSGYSDMAIGMGRAFGFHFLENFNYPYQSLSITEFWRRWHISLSTWFRDYVYIPLGGNRVSRGRHILNILVVWGLTGFWHGANWNFLLWGLYYGLLLLAEKFFFGKHLARLPKFLRWAITFFLVNIGWVLFYQTDLALLGRTLQTLFAFRPTDWLAVFTANSTLFLPLLYLPICFACSFPIFKKVRLPALLETPLYLALFLLCTTYILSSSYNPFIYFRF